MSRNLIIWLIILIVIIIGFIYLWLNQDEVLKDENKNMNLSNKETIKLPEPRKDSEVSLEAAINKRSSVREYSDQEISLKDLSQILWAANGTNEKGSRTAPSAGALYPIELYVVGKFENYAAGIYHYQTPNHTLEKIKEGDFLSELSEISLDQQWIRKAPLNIVVTGVVSRTAEKYRERAEQYVALEAGPVGQNIYLQVSALNLGTVSVGALHDDQMSDFLDFEPSQKAYYIFPIGGLK
ncbi:MAG: SagB/ThcOx family dehydrogenase [Patescibacteria group bacterium]|nr:SagB/ThcOx family dehydrogenase [Patescibacteria group bacterium]